MFFVMPQVPLVQVGYVQQQTARAMSKKTYSSPNDPNWSNQWSLVSRDMYKLLHAWFTYTPLHAMHQHQISYGPYMPVHCRVAILSL